MTQAVLGCWPTNPFTTEALSSWRKMVSAALSLWPSPSQIRSRFSLMPVLAGDFPDMVELGLEEFQLLAVE